MFDVYLRDRTIFEIKRQTSDLKPRGFREE